MADSTFLTRDVLAHDYVMQVLNAMLQRPDIITRSQMSTDAMHQNALHQMSIRMQEDAITAGFEYADAFIAASARGRPASPEPPSAASLARGLPRTATPKAPPGPQGSTNWLGQHLAAGQAGDAAKAPARRRKAGRRAP